MPEERSSPPTLCEAAEAFDRELAQFTKLTEAAHRCPLNSQKNLQRVARIYHEIGESEERLGSAVQGLVAAINGARERQQAQAKALEGRGVEITQRTEVASELLRRYGALGDDAAELNGLLARLAQERRAPGEAPSAELVAALGGVRQRLSQLVGTAQGLTEAAREADFEDIARQAHSLWQQLQALHHKLSSVPSAGTG